MHALVSSNLFPAPCCRRLDIDAVVALVQHLVEQHMPQPPTPAAVTAAAGSTGAAQATPDTLTPVPHSSSSEKGGGRGGLVLRAVLEVTGGILPINGMYSIQTSGEHKGGQGAQGRWKGPGMWQGACKAA